MDGAIPPIVVALKTVTRSIGGVVTLTAAKAARTTGWPGLTYLAVGFGIVTISTLLAGVADQVLLLDARAALVIESALTAVGFAIIGYSIHVTRRTSRSPV